MTCYPRGSDFPRTGHRRAARPAPSSRDSTDARTPPPLPARPAPPTGAPTPVPSPPPPRHRHRYVSGAGPEEEFPRGARAPGSAGRRQDRRPPGARPGPRPRFPRPGGAARGGGPERQRTPLSGGLPGRGVAGGPLARCGSPGRNVPHLSPSAPAACPLALAGHGEGAERGKRKILRKGEGVCLLCC